MAHVSMDSIVECDFERARMGVRRPPLRDVSAHPTNVLELKQNQSTPSVQQLGPKRCHRFVVVRCFNARSAGSKFADVYFCKAVFIDIAKEHAAARTRVRYNGSPETEKGRMSSAGVEIELSTDTF